MWSEEEKRRYEQYKLAYVAFMAVYPFGIEDLEGEIWKDIVDYEGFYQGSNYGRIKSFYKGKVRIIKPLLQKGGYLTVNLYKSGNQKMYRLHILIAKAFNPNPDNKPTVNHFDGNKFNNCIENLVWATCKENNEHAYKTGLKKLGENNAQAKLTNEQVRWIRENCILGDKKLGAKALAKSFGVTKAVILNIIHYRTYKNVE